MVGLHFLQILFYFTSLRTPLLKILISPKGYVSDFDHIFTHLKIFFIKIGSAPEDFFSFSKKQKRDNYLNFLLQERYLWMRVSKNTLFVMSYSILIIL